MLHTVEAIARQAGAVLRAHYERPRHADHKQGNTIDLVTAADRESEELIVPALQAAFPDHHVIGEEGGGYGPPPESTPYHWYVDPLDGTTNFAHRVPHFAVSIALSSPDLQPLLGVVYDPMRDELFKAIRGHGALLNGRQLRVSTVRDLADALVVTGFPYDRWTTTDNNIAHFGNFVLRTAGVRRTGAAALDLGYVAAGRLDVYWEHGPYAWDVQAGLLCVLEAGGQVTDYAGAITHDGLSGNHILATNGHLHAQAVSVLTQGEKAPRPSC
ncbi:MAG: inositol monophosphatase [Chloroflexi bacterium]|nr:inositol monophosphatase [Chloroflexota bacterium]